MTRSLIQLVIVLCLFTQVACGNNSLTKEKRNAECDSTFVLRDIYFEMGLSKMMIEESSEGLSRLKAHLSKCEGRFEVSVHADQRYRLIGATDITSLRAKNIVNALVELGVDSERLVAVGKNSSDPIIGDPKSEEEYAVNRRIQVKRIKESGYRLLPGGSRLLPRISTKKATSTHFHEKDLAIARCVD